MEREADQDSKNENQDRLQQTYVVQVIFEGVVWQSNHGWRINRSRELVARNQEQRNRAADEARDYLTERGGGDADFQRLRQAEPRGDQKRPGNRGAVPSNERARSE